ncbi:hypothetical protein EYR41_010626 [Orbilia oligospora]|uniref:Uncharacterized protein n=1 Tax=Orbilia oligospora TaxID=2813651 RepID=A0A8H2DN70_ORBOL|nr:hypothetical protein EYR41_010626 [Orbilia oligospora]
MTASALDLGKDNHRRVRDWFVQYAYDTRPTEMGTMTQILAAITDIDFVPDNHTISNQYNINYRAMQVFLSSYFGLKWKPIRVVDHFPSFLDSVRTNTHVDLELYSTIETEWVFMSKIKLIIVCNLASLGATCSYASAGVIRETTVICSGLSIDNIIGSRTRAKRRAR